MNSQIKKKRAHQIKEESDTESMRSDSDSESEEEYPESDSSSEYESESDSEYVPVPVITKELDNFLDKLLESTDLTIDETTHK